MIAFLLAQQLFANPGQTFTTPAPIVTPSRAPLSERGVLDARLADAAARAQALGGTLGVVVIDTATGVTAERNALSVMQLAGVQNVAIALAAYEQVDRHHLTLDRTLGATIARTLDGGDPAAVAALVQTLGGVGQIDASLRDDGLDGITLAEDGRATGSARTVATLFTKLFQGDLLSPSSRTALVAALARVKSLPGGLRAGFPPRTFVAHAAGVLRGTGDVAEATSDAGIVTVNGRTLVVVALLQHAHGGDAARAAVIADIARAVDEATKLFPLQ